jgi:DNA-binding PadR family transcriptional regulator
MREVENLTNGRIRLGPGTLYGSIKTLLEAGFIEELDEDSERRRYYKLTGAGHRAAIDESTKLTELATMAAKKLGVTHV